MDLNTLIIYDLQEQLVQQISENNFTANDGSSSQNFSLPILSVSTIGDDSVLGGLDGSIPN